MKTRSALFTFSLFLLCSCMKNTEQQHEFQQIVKEETIQPTIALDLELEAPQPTGWTVYTDFDTPERPVEFEDFANGHLRIDCSDYPEQFAVMDCEVIEEMSECFRIIATVIRRIGAVRVLSPALTAVNGPISMNGGK